MLLANVCLRQNADREWVVWSTSCQRWILVRRDERMLLPNELAARRQEAGCTRISAKLVLPHGRYRVKKNALEASDEAGPVAYHYPLYWKSPIITTELWLAIGCRCQGRACRPGWFPTRPGPRSGRRNCLYAGRRTPSLHPIVERGVPVRDGHQRRWVDWTDLCLSSQFSGFHIFPGVV